MVFIAFVVLIALIFSIGLFYKHGTSLDISRTISEELITVDDDAGAKKG
jgi:hypothetical protein